MKQITLINIYLIFLKIGAILLGGGYVILPILQSELCDKRDLISESELVDYYALSQSLPGIVAANISMFAGYKLKGKLGALTAMLGIVTVPILCIICLANIFAIFISNKYINGIFWGIGIAVIALIILTIREMWQKSNVNLFFYVIFAFSLISLLYFKLSPVCVILIYSIIGIILKYIERRRDTE